MIALNELLKNKEEYQNAYNLKGVKTDLNVFVRLEDERKKTQLDFEHKRAECNKMCGEVVKLKKQNKDDKAKELITEISDLDKQISRLQNKLNIQGKMIDNKLKKLHNIPDNNNVHNLQIETTRKESNHNDLRSFLAKFCKPEPYFSSVSKFIKSQANVLFEEQKLPIAYYCKNGIVILCAEKNIDKLTTILLDYFKENSLSIIEKSVQKIKKSSSQEYFIHLKRKTYFKLEIKREFFTREYKLKYRDSSIDMTKFVNQINLMY